MKKVIAISALFALLTGAVFAQPSLGGHFAVRIDTINSTSEEDAPLYGGIEIKGSRVNVDFNNDDGTAGGRVRLSGRGGSIGWWGALPFAFAWWKPIPQLRIQLGHNPDGDWGAPQISGWGYNAEAQDFVAIDQDSGNAGSTAARKARSPGWYGGYSELGALLSIYPADGVTINIALPFGKGREESSNIGSVNVGDIYSKFHLNVVANIPDVGALRVTFQGGGGLADNDDYPRKVSAGTIYTSFFLNAIDNLGVDLGLSFGLPYETATPDQTVSPGLGIGLGVRFTSGDFGIKARVGATLAGGTKTGDVDVKNSTNIGFGILPSFAVAGMTIYLNAGIGMSIPDADAASDFVVVDWFVNPYIRKSVSNLSFYAGFKLGTGGAPDKDTDAIIGWSVPIGFNCYF